MHVGDPVEVRDPRHRRDPHVAASPGSSTRRGGPAPTTCIAARARRRRARGGAAPANLLYVETAAGTNNDVVAAIVDGTHLPNGAYARSFRRLASDTLSAQRQFLDIGAGYATVGLLADLAAMAVLMIDRVRERRRQIAMLRALGFRGRTVQPRVPCRGGRDRGRGHRGRCRRRVSCSRGGWARAAGSGGTSRSACRSAPLVAIVAVVVIASLVATDACRRVAPAASARRGALRGDE